MEVAGECVWHPRLSIRNFRFIACYACAPCKRLEKLSAYTYFIFLLITQVHVSLLYISRHFHPGSSRFDQWYPNNGFLHHKATAASDARREMGGVAELISFSTFVSISSPLAFFTLAPRDGMDGIKFENTFYLFPKE
jgi:hypothetical protein